MTIHGTLVDVGGVGILLLGPSGVGKSECALELIIRGHRLVADDVVELEANAVGGVSGASPANIRHHLAIRGLGIVYVPDLYGCARVAERVTIDLVCCIHPWESGAEYDRVGLDPNWQELEGVQVRQLTLSARPGASMATIVEVAALEHRRLARGGESAALRLDARLRRAMGAA